MIFLSYDSIKNIEIMGIIKDNKKFKTTKDQTNPTNPTADTKMDTNTFDIDKKTIKDQKSKK